MNNIDETANLSVTVENTDLETQITDDKNIIDYHAPYNVTRPVNIEEELHFAIKEYIWRFIYLSECNNKESEPEPLAAKILFSDQYFKNYSNTIIEAMISSLNYLVLILLKDRTTFFNSSESEDLVKIRENLKDRVVLEAFDIKEEYLMGMTGKVCEFAIKYYKEYNGKILVSPLIINTKVALTDVKKLFTNEKIVNKGYTVHTVNTHLIYNPDVNMNYELTSMISKYIEEYNDSLFLFKNRMINCFDTSKRFNCINCQNKDFANMCKLNLETEIMIEEDISDIEEKFNSLFKGNNLRFYIENDAVELINSVNFETDKIIFDFIKNELNHRS